jgi:hypothetical protein
MHAVPTLSRSGPSGSGLSPAVETALLRHAELRFEAEHAARVRRLLAAQRWRRRAEAAGRRARLAAAAVR